MISTEEIQQVFPQLEPDLCAQISLHAETRTYRSGEQLMRTGQYFKNTMLILGGLVKVYREDEEGNEYFMYYLQPGQACALSMVCAVRQESSQIMAKAVKDTEVIAIALPLMDKWMQTYRSWYHFVLETYRNRFEEMLVTVDHVAFRSMDERLEFYLKKHQQTLHSNTISINHQTIADELNSSREVISRLLKKMEQRGRVKLHRNAIELVNL